MCPLSRFVQNRTDTVFFKPSVIEKAYYHTYLLFTTHYRQWKVWPIKRSHVPEVVETFHAFVGREHGVVYWVVEYQIVHQNIG
jgi:hypothetical protein